MRFTLATFATAALIMLATAAPAPQQSGTHDRGDGHHGERSGTKLAPSALPSGRTFGNAFSAGSERPSGRGSPSGGPNPSGRPGPTGILPTGSDMPAPTGGFPGFSGQPSLPAFSGQPSPPALSGQPSLPSITGAPTALPNPDDLNSVSFEFPASDA